MTSLETISKGISRTEAPFQIVSPATNFDLNLLWKEDPQLYEILRSSSTVEEARAKIYDYLNRLEWGYRTGEKDVHPLVDSIAIEAIRVFKNIISPRNEAFTGYSALSYLWRLAHGDLKALEELDEGFLLEFVHLFKAINNRAEIYPAKFAEGLPIFDFSKIKGRAAGIARSDYLDKLADRIRSYIARYPSGLDPRVIERRRRNKQKILEYFGGSEDDWRDYLWHFRHVIKRTEDLVHLKNLAPALSEEELRGIDMALKFRIPFGITPYYLHLFDLEGERVYDYQVRAQVIPPIHTVTVMSEHRNDREYYFDFMGEHDTSPQDLITRRYPMVAIIKASDTCPQICVYCQRNWEIMEALNTGAIPSKKELDEAIEWFAEHPNIIDVLITGGDPMILRDSMLEYLIGRLASLDHIASIRVGSRIVVTVPFRITDDVAEMLGSYIEPGKRIITFVTHVESAYEVTPEMAEAVYKLKRQGIPVYNQQVYTFWVSRRFETVALRIALKKAGIDPYYSFYPKGKWEHKDYMIPVARIIQERKEEARLLPGIFRTEEPVFNVPRLGKNHLRSWQDHELIMIRPDGRRMYLWHPWEKNIQLVNPYIYTDMISIKMYLDHLKEMGEDIEDYKSIWYYY